jgi:hypothetical protein
MGRTVAERQRAMRERMRRQGFVLRQLWVHPLDWPAVKDIVERMRKVRGYGASKFDMQAEVNKRLKKRATDSGTVQRSKK